VAFGRLAPSTPLVHGSQRMSSLQSDLLSLAFEHSKQFGVNRYIRFSEKDTG